MFQNRLRNTSKRPLPMEGGEPPEKKSRKSADSTGSETGLNPYTMMENATDDDLTTTKSWSEIVREMYPDVLTRTYTVPPVHFNRVPYTRNTVHGTKQPALLVSHADCVPSQLYLTETDVDSLLPAYASPPQSMWPSDTLALHHQPPRVQESDFQEDRTQTHVLRNLQVLTESLGEPAFILSQLSFADFTTSTKAVAGPATAAEQLPLAADQEEQPSLMTDDSEGVNLGEATEGPTARPRSPNPRRGKTTRLTPPPRAPSPSDGEATLFSGEFSILVVHRRYGLLVGEVKSVGRHQAAFSAAHHCEDADAIVAKRMAKALRQLAKSRRKADLVTSDVAPGLTVQTTIFLPYVSRQRLQRVLESDPELMKEALEALDAADAAHAASLCCCSDQLSDPATWWQVTQDKLSQLNTWWHGRMDTEDASLTDQLYVDIVARFVVPATSANVFSATPTSTRLDIRTMGQAVSELGRRLSCLVLTLNQEDLMNRRQPQVYITGPPGTGKTLVLTLEALLWLELGETVHIVSAYGLVSRPATALIKRQLEMTLAATSASVSQVVVRDYDFTAGQSHVDRALDDLLAASVSDAGTLQALYVIMDEVTFDISTEVGRGYQKLVTELSHKVPALRLWAAGLYHSHVPSCLLLQAITVPLRSSPAILREVQPGLDFYAGKVLGYSNMGMPSPSDGPVALRLQHQGQGHDGRWPAECEQCGREVADALKGLGVGTQENGLAYRDVFVLVRNVDLQDDFPNTIDPQNDTEEDALTASGSVTSPADCTVVPRTASPSAAQLQATATAAVSSSSPVDSTASPRTTATISAAPTKASPSSTTTSPPLSTTTHSAAAPTLPTLSTTAAPATSSPSSSLLSEAETTRGSLGFKFPARATGLVRGLRRAGFPVRVLGNQGKQAYPDLWEEAVADVAVAKDDVITATHCRFVQGLERKVVVWLRGRHETEDERRTDQDVEAEERLLAVSRATTQLIVVDVPPLETPSSSVA